MAYPSLSTPSRSGDYSTPLAQRFGAPWMCTTLRHAFLQTYENSFTQPLSYPDHWFSPRIAFATGNWTQIQEQIQSLYFPWHRCLRKVVFLGLICAFHPIWVDPQKRTRVREQEELHFREVDGFASPFSNMDDTLSMYPYIERVCFAPVSGSSSASFTSDRRAKLFKFFALIFPIGKTLSWWPSFQIETSFDESTEFLTVLPYTSKSVSRLEDYKILLL